MSLPKIDLDKFLTPSKIKDYIKSSPARPRTITKELYSKDVATHPSPVYSYADIRETTGNVPLVLRGGEPYVIADGTATYNFIEPQPISIAETLSAVDLSNMLALGQTSIEKTLKEKINRFRKIILDTIEALAIQSLNGKIDYQLKTNAGYEAFTIQFGEVENITPDNKPESVEDFYNVLTDANDKLQEKGYGQNIICYAGKTAFAKIVEIAGKYQGKVFIEFKDGGVNIGGYHIKPVNSGYKDRDGKFVRAIPDNKIKMIDKSAPFRLRYLAIDDVRAGLQATPIFIAKKIDRNITLEAQSKPLVIPVPDAIIDIEVA
jgi:hypothetical protein